MKRTVFYVLGALLSVLPPTICTLCYFPLWIERGTAQTVSGLCALMLALCALPLFRILKSRLRSPSLPLVWGILFVAVRALASIMDEVAVISFVGLLSNLIGAVFFHLAKRGKRE